jgi:uncharacterized protein YkwD
MNILKLYAWTACAVLALALFTGCDNNSGDSGSSGGSSQSTGGGGGGGGSAATGTEQDLAQQVLTLVNQERATAGVGPLTMHTGCSQVAYNHSADMDLRDFFDHVNPDGLNPFQRMQAAGIGYSAAGENIAAGYQTAAAVMNGWMNSPGHRANILNANFTEIGIGVRQGSTGQYGTYWTQVFRRP